MTGLLPARAAPSVAPLLAEIEQALPAAGWPPFRRYFLRDGVNVYLRVNARHVDGRPRETLELASVEIDASRRGQRLFSALLDGLAALADRRALMLLVENVTSDQVRAAALRRGYVSLYGTRVTPPTFVRMPPALPDERMP